MAANYELPSELGQGEPEGETCQGQEAQGSDQGPLTRHATRRDYRYDSNGVEQNAGNCWDQKDTSQKQYSKGETG